MMEPAKQSVRLTTGHKSEQILLSWRAAGERATHGHDIREERGSLSAREIARERERERERDWDGCYRRGDEARIRGRFGGTSTHTRQKAASGGGGKPAGFKIILHDDPTSASKVTCLLPTRAVKTSQAHQPAQDKDS